MKTPTKPSSTAYLSGRQKRRFLSRFHAGLVMDGSRRLKREDSYKHALVVAPSGSGKTTGYIIPNLLNLKDTSAVVLDPSGEIHEKTSPWLKKQGFEIQLLDFAKPENGTGGYNPLSRAKTATDIRKLAGVLVRAANPNPKGDAFWNDSAQGIIETLLLAISKLPLPERNLKTLLKLLHQLDTEPEKVDGLCAQYLSEDAFERYQSFTAMDAKLKSNILTTARTSLQALNDPSLAHLVSQTDEIRFETLREKPSVLFLTVPENEVKHYSFLLAVLYTQLFDFSMAPRADKKAPYTPIFYLLDEFANSGRLGSDFPTMITAIRKRKCSLSLILQDLQQLTALYGADAPTIASNCASKLYFPGLPIETCQKVEKELGNQNGKPLLSAAEVRTLKKGEALLIHGNIAPLKVKMKRWYENRRLKKRVPKEVRR